jgi:hypothetical protein
MTRTLTPVPDRLRALVGSWRAAEHIAPASWDVNGGEAIGHYDGRLALDGAIIVQDYAQLRAGRVVLRGHGVFWWDAAATQVVLHWWDTWGASPREFRGAFDERGLVLVSAAARGHARATWTFADDGHGAYALETSADGARWQSYLRAELTRAAESSGAPTGPFAPP